MSKTSELDQVLKFFSDRPQNEYDTEGLLRETSLAVTKPLIQHYVQHLVSDGYVAEKVQMLSQITTRKYFFVTVRGVLFCGRGGYQGQQRREIVTQAWTISKTIATILYSLAVLAVAIWAVFVDKSK